MDRLGLVSGLVLLAIYAFDVVAPYVFKAPQADMIRDVEQMQNTTQNLLLLLFGFLFGNSVGKRQQEQTAAKQADTLNALAQTVNAGGGTTGTDSVVLKPGDTATTTATASGTTIKGDNP
jgi:hypothetical protein